MDNLAKGSSKATNILQMGRISNFTLMECLRTVNRISRMVVTNNSNFGTEKTTKMTMVMKSKLKWTKTVNRCNHPKRSKTSSTQFLVSNTRKKNSQLRTISQILTKTKIQTIKTRALFAWRTYRLGRW